MKRSTSNNPAGRPSKGLTQKQLRIDLPEGLLVSVKLAAKAEGLKVSEWVRRAMRSRLDALGNEHGGACDCRVCPTHE